MNTVKLQGKVKPSINNRLVLVKCFDYDFGSDQENTRLRRYYELPPACTHFVFSIPSEYYNPGCLDTNIYSVEILVVKGSEVPEITLCEGVK